jgi:hypothetical protein
MIYLKLLGLDSNSPEARALLSFKDPTKNRFKVGDFISSLSACLEPRLAQQQPQQLTIDQVNAKLDELSKAANQ